MGRVAATFQVLVQLGTAGVGDNVLADDDGIAGEEVRLFGSDGNLMHAYWHPGPLEKIALGQLTARGIPKIIAFGFNPEIDGGVGVVLMLDRRRMEGEAPPYHGRLGTGSQVWYNILHQRLAAMELIDDDNDGKRDIALKTASGEKLVLNFEGERIGGSVVVTPLGPK